MTQSAADLVAIALDPTQTDFLGDLVPHSQYYRRHIAAGIEAAAEIAGVTDERVKAAARVELERRTDAIIREREKAERDDLAAGIASGDLREDGTAIEYDRYRSV